MKQSIRERRIYHVTIVGGVVNFLLLFISTMKLKSSHIMKAVYNFNNNNSNIASHC